MSVTKDGFYNIEGKMFEVVHGVEGDCLTLGDEDGGTRISGPKPWGGGQVTKTFVTQEKYGPIERLEEENAKLRELVWDMYCLAYQSTVEWKVSDAVWDKYSPCEKCHELHGGKSPCAGTSEDMTEECCEPIQAAVVADRMRELGIEVKE